MPHYSRFIFLDRDSGRWKVDPIETQRRRELFWEVGTMPVLLLLFTFAAIHVRLLAMSNLWPPDVVRPRTRRLQDATPKRSVRRSSL
jgi:hypothetical protein